MKHNILYSFLAGVALMFSTTACTPEDESMPAPDFSQEDLVEGKAFSVEIDQATNKVTMKSLLPASYSVQWIHPQGVEKKATTEANIPFAGDYELTFGVMTRGGMVYGEPYKFTLQNTNGDLLTDPLWGFITGGAGKSKTWVLDHNQYDLGGVTFCCPYMGWDKFTEGKTFTENDAPDYKDLGLDSPDWVWQAGEPDWMFSAAQWQSIPELTFDLINGANLTVDGVTKPFVMDPDRKTLTMPVGVDWLGEPCANGFLVDYVNAEIVKLNEHVLGIKVIRNDGKGGQGDQRLVFCYVEKGWDGKWPVNGPSLETKPVTLPSFPDLEEDLFTIVSADAVTYQASSLTYLMNADMPYGYMEWDGVTGNWEWLPKDASFLPEYPDAGDYQLILSKVDNPDSETVAVKPTVLQSECNELKNYFEIVDGKLIYENPVSLLSFLNIDMRSTEFTVLKCSPENGQLVIGIPVAKNADGVANRYLCLNLEPKPIGGGQTGPTVIPVDNSVIEAYFDGGNYNSYRIELYNPWGGDKTWPLDITKVRLKNKQTIKIAFRIDGATWTNAPKVIVCHNIGDGLWPGADGAAFNDPSAVTLNTSGETVVSFTNTSGVTQAFEGTSCLAICVDQRGNASSPLDANGDLDAAAVTPYITSITIE